MVTLPPANVATPLGGNHCMVNIPAGRESPENSVPNAGARMTSPSAVSETYVAASGAPELKSADVVSVKEAGVDSGPTAIPADSGPGLPAPSCLPARRSGRNAVAKSARARTTVETRQRSLTRLSIRLPSPEMGGAGGTLTPGLEVMFEP